MKRVHYAVIGLVLNSLAASTVLAVKAEPEALVLVTANNIHIDQISTKEVRKLFLGLPISREEHTLVAIANNSDPKLIQVFLQKVIFMSEHMYKRQLQLRRFQSGNRRIEGIKQIDQLVRILEDTPYSLTYMWSKTAKSFNQLHILKTLWVFPSN